MKPGAPHCRFIHDLNYGRPNNIWQDLAGRLGVPFLDGLPMLAHQAARSHTLWTGLALPAEDYIAALERSRE